MQLREVYNPAVKLVSVLGSCTECHKIVSHQSEYFLLSVAINMLQFTYTTMAVVAVAVTATTIMTTTTAT
jgi:hypothetical protein